MLQPWLRYLPYALVLWIARRTCEKQANDRYEVVEPFPGEVITWKGRR